MLETQKLAQEEEEEEVRDLKIQETLEACVRGLEQALREEQRHRARKDREA